MITRQIQDGRFMTQWTIPRYGEPSDHGAAFAFTASTNGPTGNPVYLSFAPTNAPVALSARVFLRITAPVRAYLGRGVPGWPSIPNTVWKPTNPVIATNQTVPTLAINERFAYNYITGQTYTSAQMGDPSITCQLGYVGGVRTTMNTASNPQVYNPIVSEQVVTPPTVVAAEYWNDATAAVTSICTTMQLAISAHGFVSIPIVLDEDVNVPSGQLILVEGYIDGDVRQTAFSSTSNYTVWVGNSITATPLVQTPQLTAYPTLSAGGLLSNPTTARLAATSTKLIPMENLTCANGFEYSGVLDGYQLWMPATTEAGVPTAGRTAWQFVKRGGGDLTSGISAWATTPSQWFNANRVTPILTPSVTTTTGTVTQTTTTTLPASTSTVSASLAATTGTLSATNAATAATGAVNFPEQVTTNVGSIHTTAPFVATTTLNTPAQGVSGSITTPIQAVTGTISDPGTTRTETTTGTTTSTGQTSNIAPAVTDSQFSFRLNWASLFTVAVDVQAVNAATGAVTATYPAERCLLSFNASPAGSNRLVMVITNADGTYTSIDMDTPGLQSGMTIMRRQNAAAARSMRGIMSPIGKGAV